jgi:transcriptional regulator with XRE-family HTH domain
MNILKMTRILKEITQGRLARAVDISPAMISRLEHDLLRNSPAVIVLKNKVAAALEVPAECIFPDLRKGDGHE